MFRRRLGLGIRIARLLGAAASIAAVTALATRISVNATTAGFAYLLVILLLATFGSLPEAILGSLLGGLCLNYYFLPPLYRFTIADAQDWVALLVFLATAVLVSHLSTTAKAQKEAALGRGREMEQLYSLSRAALLNPSPSETGREVANQIARVFSFEAVSLFERSSERIYRAGALDLPEWDGHLRTAALTGTVTEDRASLTLATTVRLGSEVIGSLVLRGGPLSDSALQSLANLVAIALERARMMEAANAADLVRKSEELKATLLDAIAHEFKTPLTSIKAAASALRSGVAEESVRKEFIEIVDEESDRLERLVSDAIQMARIEAGEWKLQRSAQTVENLVSSAVASLGLIRDGRAINRRITPGLVTDSDPELVQLALKQVLDNAVKYSQPDTPVAIEAHQREGEVLVTVSNQGPGIAEGDLKRIFDRYYRSPDVRGQVPGTGMGLAIAQDILLTHGGRIWAENIPGGSRVSILLPMGMPSGVPHS